MRVDTMFYNILKDFTSNNQLCIIYLSNGDEIKIYNNKKNIPYIAHVGEQYLAIHNETHITLYPYSSIIKIEIW